MPGELYYFEIYADDVDKLVDFYRDVMGWRIQKFEGVDMPAEMEYMAVNPDPEKEGPDKEGGIIWGGILKKTMPQQSTLNYFNAEGGLEAFNKRVKGKGGQVMMEKMAVPGMGWFSVGIDPEGNPFAGWEADTDAK
jgi:predicted enzyme related to lactoylglutathione lyase